MLSTPPVYRVIPSGYHTHPATLIALRDAGYDEETLTNEMAKWVTVARKHV